MYGDGFSKNGSLSNAGHVDGECSGIRGAFLSAQSRRVIQKTPMQNNYPKISPKALHDACEEEEKHIATMIGKHLWTS